MFDRRVIITFVVAVLLILADAFAIAYGSMPSHTGGAIGLFLFSLTMLILTRTLRLNAANEKTGGTPLEQSPEKGMFNLYIGVLFLTFALVSVFDLTRNEPVSLRIIFCGVDVAVLSFLMVKIYRKWTARADSLLE